LILISLHRRRRATDPRVEERHERREEHRVVKHRVDPSQLVWKPQQPSGRTDSHDDG
jgi:hypothetical protein